MGTDRRTFLAALTGAAGVGYMLNAAKQPATTPRSAQGGLGALRAGTPALRQTVSGHPLAYLDNAATTLRPRAVIDALVRYYETDNANPSATLHTLAKRSAAALEHARERIARFINAASADDIIVTRGTTEGVNLVASAWGPGAVRAGDEILLTIVEHNSNLFPWQRLAAQTGATIKFAEVERDGALNIAAIDAAITSKTRLIAIAHVSNVLGIVYPVAEVCALARRRGVAVFVDAAQSAPHVKLDVGAIGCDFLAFSSHKLLGPMGVGVLWARGDRMKEMAPYQVGSNMAHGLDLTGATYEEGGLRFQAGTPNVSGPVALAAAMDVLDGIGFNAIAEHDRQLSTHLLSRLGAIDRVKVIGTGTSPARVPVVSFTVDGMTVPAIVDAADAAGVAIRGGDLAALPLLQRHGIATAARASAYLYNTTAEIDRLADVLSSLRPR